MAEMSFFKALCCKIDFKFRNCSEISLYYNPCFRIVNDCIELKLKLRILLYQIRKGNILEFEYYIPFSDGIFRNRAKL